MTCINNVLDDRPPRKIYAIEKPGKTPSTLKNIAVPVPPSLPSRCFDRFFPALPLPPPPQVINLDVEDGKLGTSWLKTVPSISKRKKGSIYETFGLPLEREVTILVANENKRARHAEESWTRQQLNRFTYCP